MRTTACCWLAALGIAASALEASATTITSDFSTDLEGWTATAGSGTPVWTASGGNPAGYLFIDNVDGAVIVRVIAPAKFLGDLSSSNGGTLSFDGNLLSAGNIINQISYGRVRISTSSGSPATLDLSPGNPALGVWTSYSAPLDAATWGQTPARWAQILSNVTMIEITLEAVSGLETNGFDNFAITSVPEPSPAALLAFATGGGLALARRLRRAP